MRNSANQYSKLRRRGAFSFHLAAGESKNFYVKAQRVFAFFGGVMHGKTQNLFTTGRNVGVCKYSRSGNDQCNSSVRKIMLFTWKTVKRLYL